MYYRHYYLRDPNCGDAERDEFDLDSLAVDAIEAHDDSGPAEGGSVPHPRAIGLGTIVFTGHEPPEDHELYTILDDVEADQV